MLPSSIPLDFKNKNNIGEHNKKYTYDTKNFWDLYEHASFDILGWSIVMPLYGEEGSIESTIFYKACKYTIQLGYAA